MTENNLNTLVIGGAGYIGFHLVQQLVSIGRNVTVLGRSAIPKYALPPQSSYVAGDFGELELISQLLDKNQEVIHLAYATVPNTSFENPLADLLQNLPPTVQLFSIAAQKGVRLALVSSGGTVYGDSVELPISELHPAKPISPYGLTKLTLESYAYLYAKTHDLNFVCVRPANAYGVGQRPFVGQGFIATAMASVMQNRPITIFGKNGTVRDYLYVSDLASGIVSALKFGQKSETYNLGSGVGISNIDVIKAFEPLMHQIGCSARLKYLPERAFDVKANILNSTKLQEHTGWQPKVEFTDGLLLTFEWLRTRNNEFK